MKPVMNLGEVGFDDVEESGLYTCSRGHISDHVKPQTHQSIHAAQPHQGLDAAVATVCRTTSRRSPRRRCARPEKPGAARASLAGLH